MVGWVLIAATFLGVSIGLSLMQPIDEEDCVPLEQPGYGRSRIQQSPQAVQSGLGALQRPDGQTRPSVEVPFLI